MLRRAFLALFTCSLLGCPGGDGSIGDKCSGNDSCESSLQCVSSVCVPLCQRAPECGDGYACSTDGHCVAAAGKNGDACHSEVECSAGLACHLDGATVDDEGLLSASCATENPGKPTGAACTADKDCRNGTCALGRCVDLCTDVRDCAAGTDCMTVPRVEAPANGAPFAACLPSSGNLVWSIPVTAPSAELLFPVPSGARSATVVFAVDDVAQKVGAVRLTDPTGVVRYTKPCQPNGTDSLCSEDTATDQFFANAVRHLPERGQSVMQLPSSSAAPLVPGAYHMTVSSFRANGTPGSAIPRVTAVLKMDNSARLDLHFHFLDLTDHPCAAAFTGTRLDAAGAQAAQFFQTSFLGELRTIFVNAGSITLGEITYDDLLDHPDLDGLAIDDADALFSLGTHARGIDIYFVRSLSPVGLQAYGPNPGPGGLAGTRQSGIAIAVDTLCYRSWPQVARLTAHEIARYMGLFHNVELEVSTHPTWQDGIDDSDVSAQNLMFFSELGGTTLSAGQRDILVRSTVLH